LNDLIEATGLSKGSLYGNFENKDEIALAVYDHSFKNLMNKLDDLIASGRSASEKFTAFTSFYRSNCTRTFERGGCPIMNAAVEADDNLPFLKTKVQSSIKKFAGRIAHIIDQGKENGEFKKSVDAQKYAFTMLVLLEGGIMLAKIQNDKQYLYDALDRMMKILDEEIKK
jgi:AcrR family transcriptional regulator